MHLLASGLRHVAELCNNSACFRSYFSCRLVFSGENNGITKIQQQIYTRTSGPVADLSLSTCLMCFPLNIFIYSESTERRMEIKTSQSFLLLRLHSARLFFISSSILIPIQSSVSPSSSWRCLSSLALCLCINTPPSPLRLPSVSPPSPPRPRPLLLHHHPNFPSVARLASMDDHDNSFPESSLTLALFRSLSSLLCLSFLSFFFFLLSSTLPR